MIIAQVRDGSQQRYVSAHVVQAKTRQDLEKALPASYSRAPEASKPEVEENHWNRPFATLS